MIIEKNKLKIVKNTYIEMLLSCIEKYFIERLYVENFICNSEKIKCLTCPTKVQQSEHEKSRGFTYQGTFGSGPILL